MRSGLQYMFAIWNILSDIYLLQVCCKHLLYTLWFMGVKLVNKLYINKSPRTSSIVQVIFSFWCFEISEDILRNQNLLLVKIHFLTNIYHIWSNLDTTSICIDYPVESCKILVILFGSMLPNLKGH